MIFSMKQSKEEEHNIKRDKTLKEVRSSSEVAKKSCFLPFHIMYHNVQSLTNNLQAEHWLEKRQI